MIAIGCVDEEFKLLTGVNWNKVLSFNIPYHVLWKKTVINSNVIPSFLMRPIQKIFIERDDVGKCDSKITFLNF
jgi:hypothetical protein